MLSSDTSGVGGGLLQRAASGAGGGIAARLAALQHNGQTGWRQRVQKEECVKISTTSSIHQAQSLIRSQLTAPPPASYSPPSASSPAPTPEGGRGTLAARVGLLESAAQGWKARVAESDAVRFSVRGRMESMTSSDSGEPVVETGVTSSRGASEKTVMTSSLMSAGERQKRTPRAERFKCRSATNIPHTLSENSDLSAHQQLLRTSSVPDDSSPHPSLNGDVTPPHANLNGDGSPLSSHANGGVKNTSPPIFDGEETNSSPLSSHPTVNGGVNTGQDGSVENVNGDVSSGVDNGVKSGVDNGVNNGVDNSVKIGVDNGVKIGVDNGVDNGVKIGVDNGVKIGVDNGVVKSGRDDPKVVVPRMDTDLDAFFVTMTTEKTSETTTRSSAGLDYRIEDFDSLVRTEQQLVSLKSRVRVTRRRAVGSKNPIKALSERTDLIQNEYSQVMTGLADRELKRINVENLSAKNSNLAVEALAGLASSEDFSAVSLRSSGRPPAPSDLAPYSPLMLLRVKGRRHVQTRLVRPCVASVNRGDSYVLVTPSEVYHYTGQYANVIEKSRGSEIAQHILVQHDLGCSASSVFTISDTPCRLSRKFWRLLGASEEEAASLRGSEPGHPDEDELYEVSILDTNMVYELQDSSALPELVPVDKYWGTIPRIEMLDTNKILVFDFGSELYMWMGKNAPLDRRRAAVTLCKQLWAQGADYSDCDISPLGNIKQCDTRPEWCLLAKVTQHMETCLFREKFADWPDFTRVIRVHQEKRGKRSAGGEGGEIAPVEGKLMVEMKPVEPDLVLEGTHLGRGVHFFHEELRKLNEIRTLDLRVWHIEEFSSSLMGPEHHGQFTEGDSYILRWHYSVTITGRELSGLPSRHNIIGRDRFVYFMWQGGAASPCEQGAAALLTVQLDEERGPQVRLAGPAGEPPAFLSIFSGAYVCYLGKRGEMRVPCARKWRLFTIRGCLENEAQMLEVVCSIRQLRSRASLLLVNTETGQCYLWHGSRVSTHNLQVATTTVKNFLARHPRELCTPSPLHLTTLHEGQELRDFFAGLGGDARPMYHALPPSPLLPDVTPRLYVCSSTLGVFSVAPVTSHIYHPDRLVPFPYLQSDLYGASQPGLFLLDSGAELWLWQGWWPGEEEGEEQDMTDNVGAGPEDELAMPASLTELGVQGHRLGSRAHRYNEERRVAMETALSYRRARYGEEESTVPAYLVWAGLEPLAFTNLFQVWTDRDDIAEINIREGHKPGEARLLEAELSKLSRATYPLAELTQRPLPAGVDPTKLEVYLSGEHFQQVLGMPREEFLTLPAWRQCKMKQRAGLF